MMMFRHLPPTATPLPLTTLARATTPDVDAIANFETEFAAAMQVSAALTASTGRTALYLLLMSLKAAQGSQSNRCEVLLPAYTCPSLVKVIQECELTATPIEMDPATFEFDRGAFAAALSERTLAVIHVHPFGVPQPIRWLLSAVRSSGAVVIEDAAQSMGARLNDSYVGTSGDFGLYSLGPGKPLSAGGGGIMTVNHSRCSSELTESWRQLPAIRRRDSWIAVGRLAAMNAAFEPRGWWLATRAGAQSMGDDEANWGFQLSGLSAAQAAVAAEQLPRLRTYNAARRRNAMKLMDGISNVQSARPLKTMAESTESIYLRLPLLCNDANKCATMHQRLHSAGVGAGRMYKKALPDLFANLDERSSDGGMVGFAGARQIANTLLTLPTHHHLTDLDIDLIIRIIRDVDADN